MAFIIFDNQINVIYSIIGMALIKNSKFPDQDWSDDPTTEIAIFGIILEKINKLTIWFHNFPLWPQNVRDQKFIRLNYCAAIWRALNFSADFWQILFKPPLRKPTMSSIIEQRFIGGSLTSSKYRFQGAKKGDFLGALYRRS